MGALHLKATLLIEKLSVHLFETLSTNGATLENVIEVISPGITNPTLYLSGRNRHFHSCHQRNVHLTVTKNSKEIPEAE
jgi:hypothetical protein